MISGKSIIGVLAVTAIIASSCKKNPEASRLRSSKSCDIKEMGEKSDAASKAAFGCAYKSLKSAANLGSGFAGPIIQAVDAAYNLAEFAQSIQPAINMIQEGLNELNKGSGVSNGESEDNGFSLTSPSTKRSSGFRLDDEEEEEEDSGSSDSPDTAGGDTTKENLEKIGAINDEAKKINDQLKESCKTYACKCAAEIQPTFSKLLSMVKVAASFKGKSTFSPSDLKSIASIPQGGFEAAERFFLLGGNCALALDQKGQGVPNFNDAKAGMKKFLGVTEAITGIATCGVDIANGGYILYKNSMCLADDIKTWRESDAALERAREREQNQVASNCGDQVYENDNNLYAMKKLGLYIYDARGFAIGKENGPSSKDCGTYCASRSFCEQNKNFIFKDDNGACDHICGITQKPNAVSICLSRCCNGSSTCIEAARSAYYQQ